MHISKWLLYIVPNNWNVARIHNIFGLDCIAMHCVWSNVYHVIDLISILANRMVIELLFDSNSVHWTLFSVVLVRLNAMSMWWSMLMLFRSVFLCLNLLWLSINFPFVCILGPVNFFFHSPKIAIISRLCCQFWFSKISYNHKSKLKRFWLNEPLKKKLNSRFSYGRFSFKPNNQLSK